MVPGYASAASTGPRDGLVAIAIASVVLATVLIAHLVPAAHRPQPAAPAADVTCAEWSDGCRTCQRLPDGVACSTPGIACTPSAQTCERRAGG
ncbi:MAG: hypothetical protein K2Y56_21585 [Methylobacterium sp.]|uniref:hypothetical protein n=1 Tax=Methylobacterium sp. TaxID=409 RepID=UPI0025E1C05A|nr:hypothetical protein [Methylobacterium sp.]MBX9934076.1 hypothetical protein [Methylobacterium sp.]